MISGIVCTLLVIGGGLIGYLVAAACYEHRYGWLLERERDYQRRVARLNDAGRSEEELEQ